MNKHQISASTVYDLWGAVGSVGSDDIDETREEVVLQKLK